jgi:hypothetical protein
MSPGYFLPVHMLKTKFIYSRLGELTEGEKTFILQILRHRCLGEDGASRLDQIYNRLRGSAVKENELPTVSDLEAAETWLDSVEGAIDDR